METRAFGSVMFVIALAGLFAFSGKDLPPELFQAVQYAFFAVIAGLIFFLLFAIKKRQLDFRNIPAWPRINRTIKKRNILGLIGSAIIIVGAILFLQTELTEPPAAFLWMWGALTIYSLTLVFGLLK